ncbi:hypothetical protein PG997_002025 [Apiospora hydei]|uniref:DUF397 domain-containing protein n=1 Tax=Apiospora hydei TaxID=1337664 RepID=A0ABR1X8B2_9PEZI
MEEGMLRSIMGKRVKSLTLPCTSRLDNSEALIRPLGRVAVAVTEASEGTSAGSAGSGAKLAAEWPSSAA